MGSNPTSTATSLPGEGDALTVPAAIVSRERELSVLSRFVSDSASGPAALVLEGQAGIGKTAIWSQAVRDLRADGVPVLSCRCTEADMGWAFSGLGDLLADVDPSATAGLPEVQQRALAAALLIADVPDVSPGDRVIATAVLGALRVLARATPLVIAIDDVQWLDPSSRRVLTFALRRLVDEPVRMIASRRTTGALETSAANELGLAAEPLLIGPVSVGALQRIVASQLDHDLSRSVLTRLHHATGGNPMTAIEMARALRRQGIEPGPGEPLPVPHDLRALVAERLQGLTAPARRLLLVAAALARPTAAALAAAMGDAASTPPALVEVLAAGLLERDGDRLRFTHPLIASVPYAELDAAARADLHAGLAGTVSDPEEQARHAALGSPERSAALATMLDVAHRRARRRGSLDAAAELAELAVARTPLDDVDALLRRSVDVAEYVLLMGDPERAREDLTTALAAAPPGAARVEGLLLQATIASWESGDATVAAWCEQAMAEAGDDALLLARCHATLAETSPSGAAADLGHAESALALLEAMDAPPDDLLANALSNVASHRCRSGLGLAVAPLERAVALQARAAPVPVSDRAGLALGMFLKVVDQFDASRTWLQAMLTCAIDEGDDSALPIVLGHLATLECWAGDYALAVRYAVEGREHSVRMGLRAPMPASAHVLALAHQGHIAEARVLGQHDLEADAALDYTSATALHHRSLGFTELVAGDPEAAATHLLCALQISREVVGISEPAILRAHGDAVAALLQVGRLDDARRLTDELDESVAAHRHPWATAVAGRCHGQLAVAEGDLAGATAFLEQAMLDHAALAMPFEAARTRLLLGTVLRRAGRRTDARRELEAAGAEFRALGAQLQSDQASAELASVSGRRAADGELTAVEARIAAEVAAGHTNKEVAGALFMSVRTVEGHLVRIYRKLGLRSRTELATYVRP